MSHIDLNVSAFINEMYTVSIPVEICTVCAQFYIFLRNYYWVARPVCARLLSYINANINGTDGGG